jgi:hypothetical protein
MTVTVSRHARRRLKLYGIAIDDVRATLDGAEALEQQEDGSWAAMRSFPGRYGEHPLKVVYVKDDAGLVVVTAYPLKKKAWRAT